MPPEIPQIARTDTWYWLAFGLVFSVLIFGLVTFAFFSDDGSCDRWTILRYIVPVFSGIAAGSFVGAISAKGQVHHLAVAATGGFAVWLISLVVVGVPARCQTAQITNFTTFVNSETEGERSKRLPVALEVKSDTYDLSNPGKFVVIFGAVVSNIYVSSERQIDLDVRVIGLTKDEKEAWSEQDRYDSLDRWQKFDLVKKFGAAELQNRMGISDRTRASRFVVAWVIDCFSAEDLSDWSGKIRIEVRDHGKQRVSAPEYLSLATNPPQSEPINETSDCSAGGSPS